jgi:hypothetical protein
MNLGEEKNKMIQSIQDIFHEHLRVKEQMMNMEFNHNQDNKDSLDTIQNQEQTITSHLETILALEEESRLHKKQLSEYETMIRDLEDKLSDTLKAKGEETETSNKFNMIRIQANEITNKDREIERLNKLVLKLKTKAKGTKSLADASGGWSPTKSHTPVLELELNPELNPEDEEDEGNKKEETSSVIDSVLASVGEAIQKLEPVVLVEEVSEEDVVEEDTEEEDVVEEETETLLYRKKEYLILVGSGGGEGEPNVYRKDGDKRGPRVGVWGVTKSGKKKVILDK